MGSEFIAVLLRSSTSVVPELLIVFASVFYLKKKHTTIALFLTIGSVSKLIAILYYNIYLPIQVIDNFDSDFAYNSVYMIMNYVIIIGYILFSIGFVMLIFDLIKNKSQFEDSNTYFGELGNKPKGNTPY